MDPCSVISGQGDLAEMETHPGLAAEAETVAAMVQLAAAAGRR
jgi:hypothetical protein